MGFWSRLIGNNAVSAPRASVQSSSGGAVIVTPDQLEAAMRDGTISDAGVSVTPDKAMRLAPVYGCIRLIAGAVATPPLDVKRRVDDRTRNDASDSKLWTVLRRKPNPWQTPAQFKRMMTAHVLLRGNGYARIVRDARGEVQQLIPLSPDRTHPVQRADLTLDFVHIRKNGAEIVIPQAEILHLVNLTLDGVNGVTPITFARETIGAGLAMEKHGANVFKNGAQVGGVLKTPKRLGEEGRANIRASLDEYRADGSNAGKMLILEDDLSPETMAMTAEDAQWIEGRKFSRSDIAMFFGVPPHMIGDTEKSTSWGSGIEQQSLGFVAYTLEDYLTMWEERLNISCVPESDPTLYTRFNRAALVRGDLKTRQAFYVAMLQWTVLNPNEVRALEDWNPRDGGDSYLSPPNTAGIPPAATGGQGQ